MQRKTCNTCKRSRRTHFFHRDRNRSDGLYPYCVDCQKKRAAKYYAKNTAKVKARNEAYRKAHLPEYAEWARRYRDDHPSYREWQKAYARERRERGEA